MISGNGVERIILVIKMKFEWVFIFGIDETTRVDVKIS